MKCEVKSAFIFDNRIEIRYYPISKSMKIWGHIRRSVVSVDNLNVSRMDMFKESSRAPPLRFFILSKTIYEVVNSESVLTLSKKKLTASSYVDIDIIPGYNSRTNNRAVKSVAICVHQQLCVRNWTISPQRKEPRVIF